MTIKTRSQMMLQNIILIRYVTSIMIYQDISNIEYHILGDVNINFYPMNKKKKYDNTKWGDLITKYV
jgi:hypothetical protein